MIKNNSKSSLSKISKKVPFKNDQNNVHKLLLEKIENTLKEASLRLSHHQFQYVSQQIFISIFKKFEVQQFQFSYLMALKRIVSQFKLSFSIQARLMMLQVTYQYQKFPQKCLNILKKIKYIIMDTELQYMISKVFILESKVFQRLKRIEQKQNSLKKCIEYTQNFLIQYIIQKDQIRKEIVEVAILSYIEMYKLKMQHNLNEAMEYFLKAERAIEKIFNQKQQLSQLLASMYDNCQQLMKNRERQNNNQNNLTNAATLIVESQISLNTRVNAFYLWEEQKIMAQLTMHDNFLKKVVAQTQYNIKLDMGKIKLLQNSQWLQIQEKEITILQDQLLKAIGIKQQNTIATRIGFKNVSRDDIIKKDSLSSSQDDHSFLQKEDFNFIRKLGRAQSAKRQQSR